jgi:Tfp pilus assembly protein PilP
MSDKAILYAAAELSSDKYQEFSAHLQHCRFCLNLILDLRLAAEEARDSAGQPAQVLPALADSLNEKPSSAPVPAMRMALTKTIEKLRSFLSIPKLLVPLETACLVFLIVQSAFKDTDPARLQRVVRYKVGAPKQDISEPNNPQSMTPYKAVTTKDVAIEKQDSSKPVDTIYSLAPLKNTQPAPRVTSKRKKRVPRTPLEKLDLAQMKLVGIVQSPDGNKAIVEDRSGKGHILTVGSYIGTNGGRVVRIDKNRVVIAEEFEDEFGRIKTKQTILRLPFPE